MSKNLRLQRILSITKADLLSITKNPSTIIFNLGFPIIFILVLGFMANAPTKFHIAFTPNSLQKEIYQKIKKNPLFIIENDHEELILKKVQQGKIIAYINIENENNIFLKTSIASKEHFYLFESILKNYLQEDKSNSIASDFKITTTVLSGRKFNKIDFLLPGMLGFSLLSAGLFGVAYAFFHLRQKMVFKRIFCSPISKLEIIIGQLLSRLSFQVINSIILIAVGYYVFNFTLINGFSTFITLLLLSVLGMITFMSFGFMISGIAKTDAIIPALTNIISLPQWLLGGVFFSTDSFPIWLKNIAAMMPLTNLNEAMRKVSFEGVSIGEIKIELVIIFIWTFIGLFLSKTFFRWEA